MADINVIVLPDGTEYSITDFYLPVAISNPTNGQVLKYDATNQVWYNGDDAEGSSVFYGTSAPTSQLGANGNLYVKYTEGTGGASDTVDALYVKLDGFWCQISTGGGTSDYEDLTNKPQINSVELSGNKSLDDLGIQPSEISKTATGSIVTFSDGGDNIPVESFECEIVAQQASGTPTPDNPLPITGFSACNLAATGKNLFDLNNLTATDITISDGVASGTALTFHNIFGSAGVPNLKFKPNTVYSFSIKAYTDGNAGTTGVGLVVGFIYTDNTNNLLSIQNSTTTETSFNFTSTSGKTVSKIIISFGSTGNNNWHLTDIQLEENATATTYDPFGTLYSIAFGQTIYGGRLIYVNGQWSIEATHVMVDNSTVTMQKNSSSTDDYMYYFHFGDNYREAQPNEYMCSSVERLTSLPTGTRQGFIFSRQYNVLYFNMGAIPDNTLNGMRQYLIDNGVQFVYPLATPVIIPLTSTAKIKTLPGVNNIFSNTGDSTLKYFTNDADGIEELINVSETSAENTEIDDTNLEYEANNVQEALEKITKSITWAEYQALSEEEKNNGTVYLITDVNGDMQNFQPIIYSEEEREIGVWIDGKPLYEKTYIFNKNDLHSSTISSNNIRGQLWLDQKFDKVWIEQAFLFNTNANSASSTTDMIKSSPSNYPYGSAFTRSNIQRVDTVNNGNDYIWFENNYSGSQIYNQINTILFIFILRYTKTTDQAGSGQWTPQGVPAVHYSTEEQIVGTWIDGSTLYEKTIYIPALPNNTDIEYETGLSNIVQRGFDAHILFPSGNISKLPYINAANNNRVAIQFNANGKIQILTQYNNSGNSAYVTIRYTKTS